MMNYTSGYCPNSYLSDVLDGCQDSITIVVRYPKQLEMFDLKEPQDCSRVFFNRPVYPKIFDNRLKVYELLSTDSDTGHYRVNHLGVEVLKQGFDSFIFTDHKGEAVEYFLPTSHNFFIDMEEMSIPASTWELQQAIWQFKTIEEVAAMYNTTAGSIMTRVSNYNLQNKNTPIMPSDKYLNHLETSLAFGDTDLKTASRIWGVSSAVMALWISENT